MGFIHDMNIFLCRNSAENHFPTSWLRQQSAKDPNPAAEKNVDTSRFGTGKPNSCNNHIYHFHVLELLNLEFLNLKGVWGAPEN